MSEQQEFNHSTAEPTVQPFFYEIRVKGRLSDEQWTAWFSNLAISTSKGESVLQGTLPDHAALYGLLARLRDLAVPLLSVNVLDAEAQRKMRLQSRRYDLLLSGLLLLIYLLLLGGLVAITTFLASDGILHTAFALALLFATQGALAYVFSLWSDQQTWRKAWRWLAYVSWLASTITFLIFTAVANVLPTELAITLLLLLCAGGLIYLVSYVRGHAERVNNAIVKWESLGRKPTTTEDEHKDESTGQDVSH